MKAVAIAVLVAVLLPAAARASTVTYQLDLTVTSYTGPDPFGYTSSPSVAGIFDVSYDPSLYLQNNDPIGPNPLGRYQISGQLGNVAYPQSGCFTGVASGQLCGISLDSSAALLGIGEGVTGPVQPFQCMPGTFSCRTTSLSINADGTWSALDSYSNGGPALGNLSGIYTIAPVAPVPLPPTLPALTSGVLAMWLAARRRTNVLLR
jgi:hypothetical protein